MARRHLRNTQPTTRTIAGLRTQSQYAFNYLPSPSHVQRTFRNAETMRLDVRCTLCVLMNWTLRALSIIKITPPQLDCVRYIVCALLSRIYPFRVRTGTRLKPLHLLGPLIGSPHGNAYINYIYSIYLQNAQLGQMLKVRLVDHRDVVALQIAVSRGEHND